MSTLDYAIFTPLVYLGLIYGVLNVAGGIVAGRGHRETGETIQTIGFGAILLAAPYTVVLLVLALIEYPSRMEDLAVIFGITFAFFFVVLCVLLVLGEVKVAGRPRAAYLGMLVAAALAVLIVLAIF